MKLIIHRNSSSPSYVSSSQKDCEELQSQVIGSSNACEIIRSRGSAMKTYRRDSADILVHEYNIL